MDILVADAGVGKCGFPGFFDHVWVVPVASAWLFKLGHPDPDNKHRPQRVAHVPRISANFIGFLERRVSFIKLPPMAMLSVEEGRRGRGAEGW